MYGTVAKFRVKEGMVEEAIKTMGREETGKGYIGHHVYQMDNDPREFMLVVFFESKEAYHANAQRTETNTEFETMMQFMVKEPEWHDGQIVFSSMK